MCRYRLWVISVVVCCSACTPLYIPSAPIVCSNTEKGDVSLALRQGAYSTNLQGAYAATDHLNVGGSISLQYVPESSIVNTLYSGMKSSDVNLILGYYNKFTASHIFEFNIGGGPYLLKEPIGFSNYFKGFVQPSITVLEGDRRDTEFNFLMRIVGATFTQNRQFVSVSMYRLGYIEPTVSYSIGRDLKLSSQLGLSIPMNKDRTIEYSPIVFNIGASYRIKKKKSKAILPE